MKREQKEFRKTRDKFKSMLNEAGRTYINNWNINLNPRRLKDIKIKRLIEKDKVSRRYDD
jgi:predicted SprT family Zn-dependent metalloprotease